MKFMEMLRAEFETMNGVRRQIQKRCVEHSSDYMKVLGLGIGDFGLLRDIQEMKGESFGVEAFLVEEVGGQRVALSLRKVSHGSGRWEEYIYATCESDPSLNETYGFGTMQFSVLSNEWHEKLCVHLREKFDDLEMRQRNEERRRELRAQLDQVMSKLETLDFTDFSAVIGWLMQVATPIATCPEIATDREVILNVFEKHGFEVDYRLEMETEEIEEAVARWIIGRALAYLKVGEMQRFETATLNSKHIEELWHKRFGHRV